MSKAWPVRGLDPDAPLADNARAILAVRIAELYAFAPAVQHEHANADLHDMRIAAKRLRYTLELFRDVFGDAGEAMVEAVREVQEQLGQLHDHDVRIALIEDELTKLAAEQTADLGRALAVAPASQHGALTIAALRPPPDDPRRGLLALLSRQYQSRHDVYVRFRDGWRTNAADMRAILVRLSAAPRSRSV